MNVKLTKANNPEEVMAYRCCENCTEDKVLRWFLLKKDFIAIRCPKHYPPADGMPGGPPEKRWYFTLPGGFYPIVKEISEEEAVKFINTKQMKRALL